ncbi:MAG TPA: hypothetical protein VNJ04_03585 [Gemmatimonadaceae bacterium]|nr:hypothetical protein [Gemmatimonadaceae bacterium]
MTAVAEWDEVVGVIEAFWGDVSMLPVVDFLGEHRPAVAADRLSRNDLMAQASPLGVAIEGTGVRAEMLLTASAANSGTRAARQSTDT